MENVVGRILTPTIESPPEVSIHIAQFQPTERPIEDRFSVHHSSDHSRLIVGIYDGHGGPETADHVSQNLPPRLLQHNADCHSQQFQDLDDEMLSEFRRDHSLFRRRSPEWAHHALLMKSGSTALVLDIDRTTLLATYSNAGDCRLIIFNGRSATLLQTKDLNMKTPSERERLVREHPDEDGLIVGDRLFGRLMCTRGFGDGYYKLPKGPLGFDQHRKYIETISSVEQKGKIPMSDQYASIFYGYKTPPYITAAPESAMYQLEKGDVVILATDGLWDLISSEEAAAIVLQGIASREDHWAEYLLARVREATPPGDDVTVIIVQL
ncbi:hypothetical protein NLJ89_g1654 [Agrocybe chaxingu]|uniref:PPM-type phosphatase domain-containing protein n=1 Tax=Agrocybe chaxingu TaxID=84603 RepID=A0A9W8MZL3_9AGAR|nr:hypothetical protein NLJ89_g1654 [Agrocybe chaxingu]